MPKRYTKRFLSIHKSTICFCVLGIALFMISIPPQPFSYSGSTQMMLLSMVAICLVLHFYTFRLPPDGHKQSMDSSVYLACLFMYGTFAALAMLLISSLVFALVHRRLSWWQHLVNFSIYTIMITGAGAVYHYLEGQTGEPLQNSHLLPHITTLITYFVINVVSITIYHFLASEKNIVQTLNGLLKDSMLLYVCVLILSLVLTILIANNGVLGLALFTGISILLSHLFNQLFKSYQHIKEKADRDQRTGLFNHTYFENKLECELRMCKANPSPLSLAMIDIDDFKKYNDRYGHLKGDQLLTRLGTILQEEAERKQITAARYGGEEFALLMPGYDKNEAFSFVEQLRKKVNRTLCEGADIFPHGCFSFSAGISFVQADIHDKTMLVDQADQALYYAKGQGKNTVHVYGSPVLDDQEPDIIQDMKEIEQQLHLFMYKDIHTFKHSKRVFQYALDMSSMLQLDPASKRQFVLGALIHDIGKLEVPWDILNKKDKLSPPEWASMQKHVLWGQKIALSSDKFKDLAPFIELHHERYDGSGYPHGFRGEEIPRLCRMLTIIDSFDAMISERPYQPSKSVEEAIAELRACAGSQFDPQLTELFIDYIENQQLKVGSL